MTNCRKREREGERERKKEKEREMMRKDVSERTFDFLFVT